MNRYEFLEALHQQLQPRGYLEIGVQSGASLRLAMCPAVGIDPAMNITESLPATTELVLDTSDEFFARETPFVPAPLDLVLIDGLHLFEQALRDFENVERFANSRTVVVFDDVLPRTVEEASRTPPAKGDWAGDVWRIHPYLALNRPDLQLTLVDIAPTGLLLVRGFGLDTQPGTFSMPEQPPWPNVLDRTGAVHALIALAAVKW